MNIDITFTDIFSNPTLLNTLKITLRILLTFGGGLISLYALLVFRKIQILNDTIKTPYGIFLVLADLLYLVLCIGTLVYIISLWTTP